MCVLCSLEFIMVSHKNSKSLDSQPHRVLLEKRKLFFYIQHFQIALSISRLKASHHSSDLSFNVKNVKCCKIAITNVSQVEFIPGENETMLLKCSWYWFSFSVGALAKIYSISV